MIETTRDNPPLYTPRDIDLAEFTEAPSSFPSVIAMCSYDPRSSTIRNQLSFNLSNLQKSRRSIFLRGKKEKFLHSGP
jgi:hypothetical protein